MTPATTPALTLNNGVTMPALGLGVFQSPPEETIAAVETALRDGYRLIDTAAAYDNEREVGEGIRRSGVDRDEIFVTTKLWISDYGYDAAQVGFDASLRRLGLDHVDLYLLHQPVPTHFEDTIGAYKAAETFLADGRARAIGVSNFSAEHLRRLIDRTDVVPAVNQVELHPYFTQPALREVHAELGIATQAWSPLGGVLVYVPGARRVPRPADRSGHHRPRGQVRQDPGAGRPALAHRARLLRDPEVGQAAPHRRELRRLRLRADAEEVAAIDALDKGVRGGPDPEHAQPRDVPEGRRQLLGEHHGLPPARTHRRPGLEALPRHDDVRRLGQHRPRRLDPHHPRARSTPGSTSSTPPTSTRPASPRRSSARRSRAAATTSCWPRSSGARWARTRTTAASRAAGSSPRSRTRCGGSAPTGSTSTRCTAPTRTPTSTRRSAR